MTDGTSTRPVTATKSASTATPDTLLDHLLRGTLLTWWAQQQPERLAIVSEVGDRTFAELDARANQLVRALRQRGAAPGTSVAILCRNRPEWAEVWAACTRGGYRLTPVNWHLTGEEAGYIVDDCEAMVLVADARVGGIASEVADRAPGATVKLAIGGPIDGFDDYEAALTAEDAAPLDDPSYGSQMLYTSGTTGRPKGVTRGPVSAGTSAATTMASFFDYRPGEDVNLCTGPLYHAAPLAFGLTVPFLNGATIVLMDGWDAEETLRLIDEHDVTHTHMVPTMFVRMLKLPSDVRARYDVSSLRNVLHGAAPCPPAVKAALIEWLGPVVYEYYAATEGTGTWVDPHTWLGKPGTVGKVEPPDHITIVDDDGNELPAGSVGTIYLKAPDTGRFEYFKDGDKTESVYRGDSFTLGDVGYVDDDGYLFLTDRSTNLIIFGGSNVYPAEIDNVLLEHPAVLDVATIGVPDAEWGEVVKAVVELAPGATGTPELEAELIEFTRTQLARYKCPRTVDFIARLPRDDNGKIYKRRLREQYRAAVDTHSDPQGIDAQAIDAQAIDAQAIDGGDT